MFGGKTFSTPTKTASAHQELRLSNSHQIKSVTVVDTLKSGTYKIIVAYEAMGNNIVNDLQAKIIPLKWILLSYDLMNERKSIPTNS